LGGEVLVYAEDDVGYIIFNRPWKRNALTRAMWEALATGVFTYCSDSRVSSIIVYGEGGAFSAGDDIEEMLGLGSVEEARRYFTAHREAFNAILRCSKPVIAAVEGPAMGGGAELLLAADIVVASRRSTIGFPEAKLGLIPPVLLTLGTYVLGYRRAKALAFTGAVLGAEEARELGIVSLASGPGMSLRMAQEIARMTSEMPSGSRAAIRSISLEAISSIMVSMEHALDMLAQLVVTEEAKRRMKSFLESRRSDGQ